jgi:hypothetical protein
MAMATTSTMFSQHLPRWLPDNIIVVGDGIGWIGEYRVSWCMAKDPKDIRGWHDVVRLSNMDMYTARTEPTR